MNMGSVAAQFSSIPSNWNMLLKLQSEIFFKDDIEFFQSWISQYESKLILDVGCGDGSFLSFLAAHFPLNQYIGIEPKGELLSATQKLSQVSNVRLIEGELSELPQLLSCQADCVIVRLVLQHLNMPIGYFLEKMSTVLMGHGRLMIYEADDDLTKIPSRLDLLSELFRVLEKEQSKRGLGRSSWKKLLADCGEYGFRTVASSHIPHSSRNRETLFRHYLSALSQVVSGNFDIQFPETAFQEQLGALSQGSPEVSIGTRLLVLEKV